jgi:hypothetical protein
MSPWIDEKYTLRLHPLVTVESVSDDRANDTNPFDRMQSELRRYMNKDRMQRISRAQLGSMKRPGNHVFFISSAPLRPLHFREFPQI